MPGPSLPRDLDLVDPAVPTCSLTIDLPWPVDERLARLVDRVAADKLGPTSKRELAAALIQTAPDSGLALWDNVLRYRQSTVGEAAFWLPADEDPLTFGERKPGRRRA